MRRMRERKREREGGERSQEQEIWTGRIREKSSKKQGSVLTLKMGVIK